MGTKKIEGNLELSGNLTDGVNTLSISDIQEKLPTVVNDRYLHTNSSTGDLEWSEVSAGTQVVELREVYGTLTDEQLAILSGNDAVIKSYNNIYRKVGENNNTNIITYSSAIIDSSHVSDAYRYVFTIDANNKTYTSYTHTFAYAVSANPPLVGTEPQLLSMRIGNGYYKIFPDKINDKYLHTNSSTGALEWSDVSAPLMTSIAYTDLKSLRDNSQLIPGMLYRITDYTFTCGNSSMGYSSAGHQFDIIVLALSNNKLSEEARAIRHAGDGYFASNNLYAWKLWYTIDNDIQRFRWADSTNGKGVIYRMIDEFGNDLPFDFKNAIKNSKYIFNTEANGNFDASLYKNLVYNVVIKPCKFGVSSTGEDFIIPDIQFTVNTDQRDSCHNIYIGYNSSNITIGQNCNNIYIDDSYSSNTIEYRNIVIGDNCSYISLGKRTREITITTGKSIDIKDECYNINISNAIGVSIGERCGYITIQNELHNSIIDNGTYFLLLKLSSQASANDYAEYIHVHSAKYGTGGGALLKEVELPSNLSYTTDVYATGSTTMYV